jgi:aldose 1-epimerase
VTNSSITFSMHDPANSTGMPGRVEANVTYALSKNRWHITMNAISPDVRTPIQLTQHTYFQLDAFANPNNNRTVWNHTLHLPYAKRAMVADQNALPTGVIKNVTKGDIDDFWTAPHKLGFASNYSDFENHCGAGCHGYNGNWAHDDKRPADAILATLASEWSGIKADLRSNQDGIVIYTCNWNDGKSEYKSTQGIAGQDKFIPRDGCIAIEAQDWVDGINQ